MNEKITQLLSKEPTIDEEPDETEGHDKIEYSHPIEQQPPPSYPEVVKLQTELINVELCSTKKTINELYSMLQGILSFPIVKASAKPFKKIEEKGGVQTPNYLG